MTENKRKGNPQVLVRVPPDLLAKIKRKAKAKKTTVPKWLIGLAMVVCNHKEELPVRGSKKKAAK